jgi:signal transduction histidine kinase/ligand-binding sensor domain-containing protein/ActR/RegA family two-component response regulator
MLRRALTYLLSITILFIQVQHAFAQKLVIDLSPLKTPTGLSQNTIQSIYKDSFGIMWFGTQDGLNKFDGYQVIVHKHIPNDPLSLPANSIFTICEDAQTNIWVGTRKDGISKYDRKKQTFRTLQHNPKNLNSISNNIITVLQNDHYGNLWIGTENGLNLLDVKTGKIKRFYHVAADKSSLSDSEILSLFVDHVGTVWIGTANGLNRYNTSDQSFDRYAPKGPEEKYKSNSINTIAADAEQNIWVGTNRSLEQLDKKNNKFKSYKIEADQFSAGGVNPIYTLENTGGNRFWIGTNTTLQLFDVSKKQLIPVNDDLDVESNMPNDGIYALLEDPEGTLWVGTTSVGVLKYDRNRAFFPSYKNSIVGKPSAKHIVRGIAEDKGNLYLCTDAGLSYFNQASKSYKTYQHDPKNKNSLLSNYTTTVLKSKRDGKIWVGTYNSGLDLLDPATGKFKHFLAGEGKYKLNSGAIDVLMEDRAGKLWIGTSYGGINIYDPNTRVISKIVQEPKNPKGLHDNIITALHEDQNGNIWIGGYSEGLSIYNPGEKSFRHLNTKNSKLNSDVISVFHEDGRGNMWIGTMEGGLNCYNMKTGAITHFTEQNGFINNTINYITADAKGLLWITTNRGITSLNPKTKEAINYGYGNGIINLEFNIGSGCYLSNGKIAVGSINGFNIIAPTTIKRNKNKPAVILTGLYLFNKPVISGGPDSILKENILTTKAIKLKYAQSVLTIKFAALNYTLPEHNRYAYQLEGFDTEWQYVGNEQEATYTNLDPGTYVFRVKAANNDGVWNVRETRLDIVVVPPIYMTWLFKVLACLLLICAAIETYYYRISYVKMQNTRLETQVRKRTKKIELQRVNLMKLNETLQVQTEEVQAQSEELQSQSEEISKQANELTIKTKALEVLNVQLIKQKNEEQNARLMAEAAQKAADKSSMAKSTFLATMSHEIRTPLNGVLGMAGLLSKTNLDAEQEEYTAAIVTSGESLMSVINDVLDYSKIESGKLELEQHEFDLRKCIRDVFSIFSSKVAEMEIKLVSSIDERIPAFVISDSYRLKQILINLVGNGIKFTKQGSVTVKAFYNKIDDKKIKISFEVIDTGIGIESTQLDKLFKPFNQIDSSITRKFGGTGLGLVICERLIKLMGGNIEVQSKLAEGSCFKFEIDCLCSNADLDSNGRVTPRESVHTDRQALSADFALSYPFSILVAEDNLMNQRLIMRITSKLGYEADLANNGQEALDMIREKDYDLILMDVQMPELDGIQATKIIRQRYGSMPLIMAMTANAMDDDFERCITAGMDDYISKPLNIELLLKKLIALNHKMQSDKTIKDQGC